MSDIVRTIQPFYETSGPYAVGKDQAEDVFGMAVDIVGAHVGAIALAPAEGIDLDYAGTPLLLRNVQLPGVPHAALISGRHLASGNTPDGAPSLGGTFQLARVRNSSERRTKIAVRLHELLAVRDPYNSVATTAAVHEIGHSFGLPHCPETDCIMTRRIRENVRRAEQWLVEQAMFCGDCTSGLQQYHAPYTATAA